MHSVLWAIIMPMIWSIFNETLQDKRSGKLTSLLACYQLYTWPADNVQLRSKWYNLRNLWEEPADWGVVKVRTGGVMYELYRSELYTVQWLYSWRCSEAARPWEWYLPLPARLCICSIVVVAVTDVLWCSEVQKELESRCIFGSKKCFRNILPK